MTGRILYAPPCLTAFLQNDTTRGECWYLAVDRPISGGGYAAGYVRPFRAPCRSAVGICINAVIGCTEVAESHTVAQKQICPYRKGQMLQLEPCWPDEKKAVWTIQPEDQYENVCVYATREPAQLEAMACGRSCVCYSVVPMSDYSPFGFGFDGDGHSSWDGPGSFENRETGEFKVGHEYNGCDRD